MGLNCNGGKVNLNNSNREDSVKFYQVNSVFDSNLSIDFTRCQQIDNGNNKNKNKNVILIPSQSNSSLNHGNFCTTNLHDKNNQTIFHQNIRGIRNKTNEIYVTFHLNYLKYCVLLNIIYLCQKFNLYILITIRIILTETLRYVPFN